MSCLTITAVAAPVWRLGRTAWAIKKSSMYVHIIECIADETVESLFEPDPIMGGIKEARVYMWPKRVKHVTAQTGFAFDDGRVQMTIKPD